MIKIRINVFVCHSGPAAFFKAAQISTLNGVLTKQQKLPNKYYCPQLQTVHMRFGIGRVLL